MGFIRQQQENLAVRLLTWQYQRKGLPVPPLDALQAQARRLVDDAHQIARKSGKNIVVILKDMVEDLKNNRL